MISFSKEDLDRIQQAVHAAEGSTSGEIVPFVAARSDAYPDVLLRTAMIGALLGVGIVLVAGQLADGWEGAWTASPVSVAAAGLLFGGLAWLSAYAIPGLRRQLAGEQRMAVAVHRRAREAFLDEEVFDTRDRTGILLFVSLFERRIEVMGDAGINARVSPDDWGDVIDTIRQGIVRGEAAQGIVDGIRLCGDLLTRQGVEIKPDDTNELPDGLRIDPD
ncbi:MAG: hypothetical protein JJ896_16455 [Rhodothermales bacterium]|nr:hypothetical protein [Rhodothermales bacterium]MBO6781249.1 hypothetical protein [Rhodothermales bacterium]